MNHDQDLHDELLHEAGSARAQAKAENPLKWLHRSLRGRYHWAALAGVVLALPFGIGGYFVLPPVYQSTGLVQVSPTLPKLLYTTDEAGVPPMFQSYVTTLGQLMKTRRVLDKTLDNPDMRRAGWPRGLEGVAALESTVSVGVGRNGQLISVMATDQDPRRAQVAVNALLEAFMDIHGEQSGLSVSDREQQLIQRSQQLNRELDTRRSSIARISQEFGTDDLTRIHEAAVEKMQRVEDEIMALSIQFEALSAQRTAEGPGSTSEATIEQLAPMDKNLAELVDHRGRVAKALELTAARFGPNHRQVRDLQKQIDTDDRLIEVRVAELRAQLTGTDSGGGLGGTLAKMQSRLDQLKTLLQISSDEARDIGNKRLAITRIKEEERDIKNRLGVTEKSLEALTTEKPQIMAGRVTIVQRGELPSGPSNDRRKALAGAGGFGGFALGVGIIGLLGFMKRGYRYLDELTDFSGTATLLGTLPDLDSPSEEDNQLAALAIHHVRNMLHVLSPGQPGRGRFFSVTSASAGEGKTSLTLALGMSFAVAGQKTLVVDADLIGRGLTAQLGLEGMDGLAEATEASDLTRCVHATKTANLCAMPAGAIPGFDPERLSEADIERIMKRLRERFDTILVDTGPILGSLEADIVCARADRVVMAISRGQAPKLVQASLARLRHLGARSVGLVFNRATQQDMTKSISHVSIHSESIRQLPAGAERTRRRMTPLARAVGGKNLAEKNALNGATGNEAGQGVEASKKKEGEQVQW